MWKDQQIGSDQFLQSVHNNLRFALISQHGATSGRVSRPSADEARAVLSAIDCSHHIGPAARRSIRSEAHFFIDETTAESGAYDSACMRTKATASRPVLKCNITICGKNMELLCHIWLQHARRS